MTHKWMGISWCSHDHSNNGCSFAQTKRDFRWMKGRLDLVHPFTGFTLFESPLPLGPDSLFKFVQNHLVCGNNQMDGPKLLYIHHRPSPTIFLSLETRSSEKREENNEIKNISSLRPHRYYIRYGIRLELLFWLWLAINRLKRNSVDWSTWA